MCLASPLLYAQDVALVRTPAALSDALPDSPGAKRALVSVSSSTPEDATEQQAGSAPVAPQKAPLYARTIPAGLDAEPWHAKEKFVSAFRKQVSFSGLASPVFTAGVQQLRDSRPHYGTDSGAYGARIGAAYARQSTQQVLNIGVMSALLRDDPRYYVLGPTHTFKSRVIYAASRVFITRTDGGGNAPNIPLFTGVVASQALAESFYPDQDRRWSRIATGSLGSLASKMATQQFKEFSVEIRQHLPFRKKN